MDGVVYGHANDRPSGLEIEHASVVIEALFQDVHLRVVPDLVGIDTRNHLWEAWLAWAPSPSLRFTAGQMRVALNSEWATLPQDLAFIGPGFPSYLSGRTDVAVRVDGEMFERLLWYQLGYAFGHGFDVEGGTRRTRQWFGRLIVHPFSWIDCDWIEGVFVGGGISYSPHHRDPVVMATPLESTVFTTADLNGDRARFLHGEFVWQVDGFRVGFERVVARSTT